MRWNASNSASHCCSCVNATYERHQDRLAYASPTYASPTYASPTYASPTYASPTYVSPTYASPTYASPTYASPTYASPTYASPTYASPNPSDHWIISPFGVSHRVGGRTVCRQPSRGTLRVISGYSLGC